MSNNIKNNNKVRFMKQLLLISFMILTVNILAAQDARDYLLKAKALMERGHTEESADLLSKAVSTINDSRLYVLRGDVHSDMGKYSEAISDYKSANEISQGSGEYGLARIYALKGDANPFPIWKKILALHLRNWKRRSCWILRSQPSKTLRNGDCSGKRKDIIFSKGDYLN